MGRLLMLEALIALSSNQNRQNNTCHPNPTALVGNWLTGRGSVIEVVKAR